ncbi:oxidoreductase domain protein [Truepera radiovictrix DSM 17093]|uniref:Oxidoreductase domain protein n=1 Tax=Truepera radiovictrix (strain DSM 17093 / CIP 108686 / LMG 22925 / RQ-24) TaxID=649638 RepID=D7CQH3_TRURR|nr:Gfo/Idh/MocA family oxidoreductase [Truepera radiovictrix]ADI14957.1 oxidoreductase domain protein [Truepera radiovictrix DSM 17093]WMT56488.1 Gfo/Idh/MocA family oxidoreductase [Truepera radiovictrix]
MQTSKRRYALVGTGARAGMYIGSLLDRHAEVGEVVAFCDPNGTRMAFYQRQVRDKTGQTPPAYHPRDFDRLLAEVRPDTVIVTSIDRTHHHYIIRALEAGSDAITEKPMTTTAEKCQAIIGAVRRTGRALTVTFNYRYSPRNAKVKELIQSGEIGEVLSVHFEWLLDTRHGADYFRRWHRDKRNSGGLMVHKASHHFDLVNWWLGDVPEMVFAMGGLRFYGRDNAEARGVEHFYSRAYGSEAAKCDPFAIDLAADPELRALYLDAEHEDGYFRDQSVFGDGISIEDTMAVLVRYEGGAVMSYSLNAHCPWEGYRVMLNGTKGRLEVDVVERSYVSGSVGDHKTLEQHHVEVDPSYGRGERAERPTLLLQKHWERAQAVPFEEGRGGHGGGDVRLLDDLFFGASDDPLGRAAGYLDGARSVLTGVAANQSLATGLPVNIGDLVKW